MKIILTGGHLSPLLSAVEGLQKENDEILVIGRKYALEGDKALSLEYHTIQNKKVPFESINAGRLQRKLTRYTLSAIIKLPVGIIQSFLILWKFKPDVILSFGGYIALPVVFCASILRIPVVIHEQTLESGLSNKIASYFAKKICISWQSSSKFFPKEKVVLTGNPIRSNFLKTDKIRFKKDLPTIYITGGSLGSHSLNVLIEGCIKELVKDYFVFHQTGGAFDNRDFNNLSKIKENLGNLKGRYFLTQFVNPGDVAELMSKADLVISRSGINTITELIYLGKPAVLFPLYFSQKNEQLKNAFFLKELGLGEIIEKDANSSDLYKKISRIFSSINDYKKAGEKAKEIVKKDAAENIIKVVKSVLNEK